MQRTGLMKSLAIVAAAGLTFVACGDDAKDSSSTNGSSSTKLCDASKGPAEKTKVKLQLQWFTQAQFAGYYAAVDQGCYAEAGLDVEIIQGAVEICKIEFSLNYEFANSFLERLISPVFNHIGEP